MRNIPDYAVVRSGRKTVSLVFSAGEFTVRAPWLMKDREIAAFVESHVSWMKKQLEKYSASCETAQHAEKLTEEEIRALADRALEYIPKRAEYYAPLVGVEYGRITIRNQKTKWGSCSAKGNLNFNCLLMLAPPEVTDAIVVHELCHLKFMNHSADFYSEVKRVYPDYDRCNRWLKQNGASIMARMK